MSYAYVDCTYAKSLEIEFELAEDPTPTDSEDWKYIRLYHSVRAKPRTGIKRSTYWKRTRGQLAYQYKRSHFFNNT